jgi:hypothetical protein
MKLTSKILGIGILVILALIVIADPGAPGVTHETPAQGAEDGDGAITSIGFYVTNDSFNYIHNITLECNFSYELIDRNVALYDTNCSQNDSSETNFNTSGNNFTQPTFFNGSIQIPTATMYMHYRLYVCNNNSECARSSNYSVFYSSPTEPVRAAPTIDLLSPTDGYLSRSGNITFNVSWTPTDNQGTTGNISFYWNVTPTPTVDDMNYTANTVTFYSNETMDNTSVNRISFDNKTGNNAEYYNFTTDEIRSAVMEDNVTIFWTAYGCNNNGSLPGNCSWATSNWSVSVDYVDPNVNAPVIQVTSPSNGSTGNDSLRITVEATDDVNLDNITVFWFHQSTTYPAGNETAEIYTLLRLNDTLDLSATDGNTSVTHTFSYDGLLHNITADFSNNTVPGTDGWVVFNVLACDNSSSVNCANASALNASEMNGTNFFYEVDTTAPNVNAFDNQTINFTCDTWEVNLTTDEEVNMSITWYQVYENLTGKEEENYTATQTDFNTTPRVNLTEMVSNYRYAYNITICDEQNNCNTSTNTSLSYNFRFPQSLCEGWTHVGILGTTFNMSTYAPLLNSSYLAWWNKTNQSFLTFVRDTPSLGGDINLTRGDGVLVNMDHDSTWPIEYRNIDVNDTFDDSESWANVTGVSGEWTNLGLLQDKTPWNISHGFVGPVGGNITFYSIWLNNDTQSAYWDHIFNRTRNQNRTILFGESLWFYAASNFSLQRNGSIFIEDF